MPVPLFDLVVHLCALTAASFAQRAFADARGWQSVPARSDDGTLPSVSVIVPARNEAATIERCVRSLLAQRHHDLEVLVVDDRSSDATPTILARLAAEDRRLTVVAGASLPAGWVGKPWALSQGVRRARGSWLLFTDADTWHAPDATASAQRFALEGATDMLSLGTGQELGSFWEKAALPSILGIVLLVSGPIRQLNDPLYPERALANGQYILIRRAAYDALGGHGAVRAEIAEDLEFARHLKNDGRYRLIVAEATELVRVRMYRSLAELWRGFTKNIYVGAHGDPARLGGGVAFLLAISVLPPVLGSLALARRRPLLAAEAFGATLTTMALTGAAVARVGIPFWYGVYQPLGHALMALITLNSWTRVASGRGVEWRGRSYSGRYKGERP